MTCAPPPSCQSRSPEIELESPAARSSSECVTSAIRIHSRPSNSVLADTLASESDPIPGQVTRFYAINSHTSQKQNINISP